MSIARSASAWQLAAGSTTLRQFSRAGAVAAAAMTVGLAVYLIEKAVAGDRSRFMQNPTDVMMRALALAHFLVGWLYLFSSPRLRSRAALARLAVCSVLGAGLCLLFARFESVRNPYLVMFFWGYFLVHEIRDETSFFQLYGDAPQLGEAGPRFLELLRQAATISLMTLLALCYAGYAWLSDKETPLAALHPAVLPVVLSLLAALCLAAWRRAVGFGLVQVGSIRLLAALHLPLLLVYAAIAGVLVLGTAFGSAGFNLIILLHVSAWIAYVPYQLEHRPGPRSPGLWGWLRTTPAGFLTLHLGLAAAILVLMAVRVHAWGRVGIVSIGLASSSFVYWGLMHISMAFWAKK